MTPAVLVPWTLFPEVSYHDHSGPDPYQFELLAQQFSISNLPATDCRVDQRYFLLEGQSVMKAFLMKAAKPAPKPHWFNIDLIVIAGFQPKGSHSYICTTKYCKFKYFDQKFQVLDQNQSTALLYTTLYYFIQENICSLQKKVVLGFSYSLIQNHHQFTVYITYYINWSSKSTVECI